MTTQTHNFDPAAAMDNLTAAQWVTKARYHVAAHEESRMDLDIQYHWNQVMWIATALANAGFDVPKPYTAGFLNIRAALEALSQKFDAENIAAA